MADWRGAIQEVWEIRESPQEIRDLGYPFILARIGRTGHQTWFECRTVEEARGKLNAVLQELNKTNQTYSVA